MWEKLALKLIEWLAQKIGLAIADAIEQHKENNRIQKTQDKVDEADSEQDIADSFDDLA